MINNSWHRWIKLIVAAALLTGCADTGKKRTAGPHIQLSPALVMTESRASAGLWSCANYSAAPPVDPSVWGAGQIAQEYVSGYVIGLFEGQGRNFPVTEASIASIQQLLDTTCLRTPHLSLQRAADSVGQTLYRQLGRSRSRNPAPLPGATPAMRCAQYNDSKLSDAAAAVVARYAANNWTDGYVTALLDSAHRVYEPNTNKVRVVRLLATTCSDNPKLTIQDAAEALTKPLIASSARQRAGRQRGPAVEETTDF